MANSVSKFYKIVPGAENLLPRAKKKVKKGDKKRNDTVFYPKECSHSGIRPKVKRNDIRFMIQGTDSP
jgi:hypothetical protein